MRENSRLDSIKWQKRSRIKWLSIGDAPTKHFFAQFKARCSRETLRNIRIDEDSYTSSDLEVRERVHSFYKELFTSDPHVVSNRVERAAVLSLITKKVTSAKNVALILSPSILEIEHVAMSFQNEKSPGLDGITIGVLHKCWPFIKFACFEMVLSFWQDGVMPLSALAGVIKLIPKDGDLSGLTNWRPITMIMMTYKIISKLLANRLKPLIPRVVDNQQTGFVPGHSITDNLLAFRLGEEFTRASKQKIALLKVDFVKAYDKVEHIFLWDTMEAMGFDYKCIVLVRGLVEEGFLKVHFNGLFTLDIPLMRGVWQGCSIAPFLSVLSTQPFMALLEKNAQEGELISL